MVGHDLIRHIDSLMSDEIVDCESLKIAINKLVKAYIKNSDRLDKITKLSDKQQIEMLKLNENLESAYSELDIYKNHLEERVHAAVSDIRLLNEELSKTQIEVIFTMGAIGESRSKETGNHVKRVAEYSKILALAYGLDKEEAELLKRVSPMHDIGKVAIPDHILNKPGKLTEEEITRLIKTLKGFTFPITDYAPFEYAIVTAGGVSCAEVNPYTMESLKIRGLYFAGEVLDLDANTGGYNLQIAFSTGRLAGLLKK